ncbi:hypothetical protein SDC9_21719 [bioreactor metagenome]|uniref:Uncharacterized protein n=1 Tax=bioreactor metagenome TaxID=1076179 RepID=A0A644UA88_9ZZZZ|nr:hypothetical protein [Candidatus Elulimicrobiales bacterium]
MKKNKRYFSFLFLVFTFLFIATFSIIKAQVYTISSKVTIDWEVLNSYTPPFYEGKSLAAEQADIKAIADAEIFTPVGVLDKSKLFYAWTYNDYYVHNYSKTGGNIIYITLDPLKTENVIRLKVYENNRQENLLAEKIIRIYPKKITPILYKKSSSPIITYSNALNKKYEHYAVNRGESLEILAEPYFFSAKSPRDENLSYTWSLNGIPGNINRSNVFDYRAPVTAYGDFGIGLTITNDSKLLQKGETLLNFLLKQN